MKKLQFIPVLILFCLFFAINTVQAGIVNVRFTNPQYSGNNFCATVQVKAQDIDFELGSSTIFFNYNKSALKNPQFTALNFKENSGCNGNGGYFNSFNALDISEVGEANYAILLGLQQQGCPTVTNTQWIDVAEFCFEVINANEPVNIDFNLNYTAFNTSDNNGEKLIIGSTEGIYNTVTGINTANNFATELSVALFPNKTEDLTYLAFTNTEIQNLTINVYDLTGKLMQTNTQKYEKGNQKIPISLKKYVSGIYFVELSNGKNSKTSQKVVLSK